MAAKQQTTVTTIAIIIIVAIAITATYFYIISLPKKSVFIDGQGNEQTISNYQECMDWAMPWEEKDGITHCYAPGGITFTSSVDSF